MMNVRNTFEGVIDDLNELFAVLPDQKIHSYLELKVSEPQCTKNFGFISTSIRSVLRICYAMGKSLVLALRSCDFDHAPLLVRFFSCQTVA